MKKITVAALLLSICFCFVLGSCAAADIKTKVHLTIRAGDYTLFNQDVTVKTAADNTNGPSVLDVLHTVMDENNVPLELDGNILKKLGLYYETDYEGATYYWSFTINGEEPKAGKSDTNYLKEGDVVVYRFVTMTGSGTTTQVSEYDSSTGVFEEILATDE